MANLLRGLNATLSSTSAIYNDATLLGEDLFYAPSVFSYFSPQYRTEKGLLGPEFQIYSTQTAASRAGHRQFGDLWRAGQRHQSQPDSFCAIWPPTSTSLVDHISYVFLHSSMSSNLKQAATDAANAAGTPTAKAQAALYIVLTSAEYQVIQ